MPPRPLSGSALGRLTRRPEFLAAAKGRRFHTDRMSLQALRRQASGDVAGLRVGLTITKKVGHATERNRIRRRLRAAAVEALASFAAEPADLVVIGRRPSLDCAFSELRDDLLRGMAALMRPAARRSAGSLSGATSPT